MDENKFIKFFLSERIIAKNESRESCLILALEHERVLNKSQILKKNFFLKSVFLLLVSCFIFNGCDVIVEIDDDNNRNGVQLLETITDSDDSGGFVKFEYDKQNRIVKWYGYEGTTLESTTTFNYNNVGDLVSIVETSKNNPEEVMRLTYSKKGNIVTITSNESEVINEITLNEQGLPVRMKTYEGEITQIPYITIFEYQNGKLSKTSREYSYYDGTTYSISFTYTYNSQSGNLIKSSYNYVILKGNLVLSTTTLSSTYTYDNKKSPYYNSIYRSMPIWYNIEAYIFSHYYYSKNNLLSISESSGITQTYTYTYDDAGFPLTEKHTIVHGTERHENNVSYTYIIK